MKQLRVKHLQRPHLRPQVRSVKQVVHLSTVLSIYPLQIGPNSSVELSPGEDPCLPRHGHLYQQQLPDEDKVWLFFPNHLQCAWVYENLGSSITLQASLQVTTKLTILALNLDYESETDQAIASDDSQEDVVPPTQQADYFSIPSGSNSPRTPRSPLDEIAVGKRAAFSASAHASLDVDDEDKPHVSFKATPHPPHYDQRPDLELDFNILPAKAQYLILNDLIRSHSEDTAVVFTTLPAPAAGTYQDEEKSVEYVSGLELLCEDIPPVLLIHSNSLVVTLAL